MIPDRTRYSKVLWLDSMDRPSEHSAGENEYFLIDIQGVTVIVNKIITGGIRGSHKEGIMSVQLIHKVVKTWVLTNPIQFVAEV